MQFQCSNLQGAFLIVILIKQQHLTYLRRLGSTSGRGSSGFRPLCWIHWTKGTYIQKRVKKVEMSQMTQHDDQCTYIPLCTKKPVWLGESMIDLMVTITLFKVFIESKRFSSYTTTIFSAIWHHRFVQVILYCRSVVNKFRGRSDPQKLKTQNIISNEFLEQSFC